MYKRVSDEEHPLLSDTLPVPFSYISAQAVSVQTGYTAAIVEALATAEGVAPAELDVTLSEEIDCDAVERLAAESDTEWTLWFDVRRYRVTVESGGSVTVEAHRSGAVVASRSADGA